MQKNWQLSGIRAPKPPFGPFDRLKPNVWPAAASDYLHRDRAQDDEMLASCNTGFKALDKLYSTDWPRSPYS
jgi:hypothetical protein